MPKKMVTGQGEAGGGLGVTALPTWQATGLSLAVIVGHVFSGSGAIVFGLLSVGVIWTLHRLHTLPLDRGRRPTSSRRHRGRRPHRQLWSFSSSRTC